MLRGYWIQSLKVIFHLHEILALLYNAFFYMHCTSVVQCIIEPVLDPMVCTSHPSTPRESAVFLLDALSLSDFWDSMYKWYQTVFVFPCLTYCTARWIEIFCDNCKWKVTFKNWIIFFFNFKNHWEKSMLTSHPAVLQDWLYKDKDGFDFP